MHNTISLVKESYTRCMGRNIIERFYDIFLKSHPSIAPKFAKTNLKKQKELLKNGIHLAIMFNEGNTIGKNGIQRIRESHSKKKLNIKPQLYLYWKKSFLQAVSETDPQFSEEDRTAWDNIIQKTINYIIEGYNK